MRLAVLDTLWTLTRCTLRASSPTCGASTSASDTALKAGHGFRMHDLGCLWGSMRTIKTQSGQGRGKAKGSEVPLYARGPKTEQSDLSKFVSHDVSDKPWTPSSQRAKRKRQTKTAKYMVDLIEREQVAKANEILAVPNFRAGDVLEVTTIVPENQGKKATYRGICIARRNRGMGSSFIIRNVVKDSPFELHFPTHSPLIQNIKVVEKGKAKRSKLYNLRSLPAKYSRV
ncbi:ribosomal protein L19 [Chloropicon roscoffensis]|uniref:Ribosomal protein L19 n=1 Tax=Chloropicon roscoffensis TaxID=1461544 RepID=A0AAX4NYJ1_9CHLO|mmetsp:Transcript_6674/g.22985  ORF Transcript_6674/g.22985 Transcript_6674/m.22985 type:complete len:229 (-) Transcript_6674:88-774(-)